MYYRIRTVHCRKEKDRQYTKNYEHSQFASGAAREKPFCTEENEQCWQQNRVDHFVFDR